METSELYEHISLGGEEEFYCGDWTSLVETSPLSSSYEVPLQPSPSLDEWMMPPLSPPPPPPVPKWAACPKSATIFEPMPDQFSSPMKLLRAQLWSFLPFVRPVSTVYIPSILRALRLILAIGCLSQSQDRATIVVSCPFLTTINVPHWGWLLGRLAAAMSLVEHCDRHGFRDDAILAPSDEELDEFHLLVASPVVHQRLYFQLSHHFSGLPTNPSLRNPTPCHLFVKPNTKLPFIGNWIAAGLALPNVGTNFDDALTRQLTPPSDELDQFRDPI
jgi:hypothetical protein